MDLEIVYLIGFVVTFMTITTGIITLLVIKYKRVSFPDMWPFVGLSGLISTLWFFFVPVLVLSCISFLLSIFIVRLLNVGGTNE